MATLGLLASLTSPLILEKPPVSRQYSLARLPITWVLRLAGHSAGTRTETYHLPGDMHIPNLPIELGAEHWPGKIMISWWLPGDLILTRSLDISISLRVPI